jgi:hypothetical protein
MVSNGVINLIRFDRQMHYTSTIHFYTCYCRRINTTLILKHFSSSEQTFFWANVFLVKFIFGHTSLWANVFQGNVFLGKCPPGQMSFLANVFGANVFLGKCLSGQMSFWAELLLLTGKTQCYSVNHETFANKQLGRKR